MALLSNLKDKYYSLLNPVKEKLSNLTQNVIPQAAAKIANSKTLNKAVNVATNPQYNIFATDAFQQLGVKPLVEGAKSLYKYGSGQDTLSLLKGNPKPIAQDIGKMTRAYGAMMAGPTEYGIGGLIGAGLNPQNPIQGVYQGIGMTQQYGGLGKFTTPAISSVLPQAGPISNRFVQGGVAGLEGIGQDFLAGQKSTPLSIGMDVARGFAGKPFRLGETRVKGMDQGRIGLKWHPDDSKLLDQLLDHVKKNGKVMNETDWKTLGQVVDTRLANGYLRNDVIDKVIKKAGEYGDPVKRNRAITKGLLHELEKSLNKAEKSNDFLKVGIQGNKSAQAGLYDAGDELRRFIAKPGSPEITPYTGAEKVVKKIGNIEKLQGENGSFRYLYKDAQGNIVAGVQGVSGRGKNILSNIYTAPEMRNKGIATELVNQVKKDFPKVEIADTKTDMGARFFRDKNVAQQPLSVSSPKGSYTDNPMIRGFAGDTKELGKQLKNEVSIPTKATEAVSLPESIRQKGQLNINKLNVEGEGKSLLQAQEAQVKPTVIGNKEVVDAARTAKGSKTLTDDQMKKLMAQQLKNRQQVVDLTGKFNKLKAEGASEQELAKVMLEIADQSRTARQGGTFAGRLLQAQNIMADNSASPMQRILALLDNAGVSEEKYMKDAVKVNWNNSVDVIKFYRKYVPPKMGELLDEIRYSNMLSSPLTHITNIASNALQTGVVAPIEKTITGTLDFGKHLLTGTERKYYAGAGIDYAGGYVKALPDAFKKAWNVISGKDIGELRPDFENVPTGVGGPLKAYTTPLRALEAMDQFFKTLVTGGVTKELSNGPQKLTLESIADSASKEANYRLFRQKFDPNGELGQGVVLKTFDKWNSAISNLRRLPGGKWVLPFLQTPTNILKQGVEYSPLGLTTMVGAEKPIEQLSKALIGTSVFMGAYELAKNGLVSWDAPTGDKERSLYYDAGLQPYSVKIGDKWVSFSKLGPLSYPMAMASALANVEKTNPEKGQIEKISKSVSGMLKFFGDQSYVRSIGDLVEAIQGGVNIGPTALSSEASDLAGQLVPYKSFLTWLGRITDPTYRKAKTFGEKMVKDLPVLGEKLEPYTNLQGKPSVRDFPLVNALSPYKITQEKSSIEAYDDYKVKRLQKAADKQADEKFMSGDLTQDGKVYRYLDDNGNLKKIPLERNITLPKLTGSSEIDKKLMGDYKRTLSTRVNEIVTLFKEGQMSLPEATKQIADIQKIQDAIKKTTVKPKKFKAPKLVIPKTKKVKIPKPKIIKAKKYKIVKPKFKKVKKI